MIVSCEACGTSFKINEDKLKGKPGKFTCKKCGNKQVIYPPGYEKSQTASQPKPENMEKERNVTLESLPAAQESQAPSTQEAEWFVAFNQDRMGPWDIDQVREWLFKTKPIGAVLVWKNGFGAWKSIKEVDIFAAMLEELELRRKKRSEVIQKVAQETTAGKEEDKRPRMQSAPDLATLIGADKVEDISVQHKEAEKLDLASLVNKDITPDKPAGIPDRPRAFTSPPIVPTVDEYKPPTKKKIPWIPILFLPSLAVLMCVVVLGLAFYKVVSIPGLDGLPGIGHHFKEDKITYEELHQKYVNMVQLNEQKLQMEAQKELELKAAEIKARAEKQAKKRAERRARLKRRLAAAKRRGGSGGKGSNAAMMEFNFDEADDSLSTKGKSFGGSRDKHLPPLSQKQIARVVKKHKRQLVDCFAQSREVYNEKLTGEVVVGWTISFRGSVRSARVVTRGAQGTFLEDCVVERIENWRFPRSGGSVRVQFPFTIR